MSTQVLLEKIHNIKNTDPMKLYKLSCENLYASAVRLVALITGLSLPEAEVKFARGLLDADSLDLIDDADVREVVAMYRELIGLSFSMNMLYANSYALVAHASDFERDFSKVVKADYAKKFGYLHLYLFSKLGVFTLLNTVDYDNLTPDVLNQEMRSLNNQLACAEVCAVC